LPANQLAEYFFASDIFIIPSSGDIVDFIIPELEVFIFYVSYFIECLEKKRKLLLLTY